MIICVYVPRKTFLWFAQNERKWDKKTISYEVRPLLYKIGQNSAAACPAALLFIRPFLSYSAEISASWQHSSLTVITAGGKKGVKTVLTNTAVDTEHKNLLFTNNYSWKTRLNCMGRLCESKTIWILCSWKVSCELKGVVGLLHGNAFHVGFSNWWMDVARVSFGDGRRAGLDMYRKGKKFD